MQKIIDIVNEEFKERNNLGGNWEAYEVEEYLEEIQTSLISKIQAINVIQCCTELKCSGCKKPLNDGLCGSCCSDLASGNY